MRSFTTPLSRTELRRNPMAITDTDIRYQTPTPIDPLHLTAQVGCRLVQKAIDRNPEERVLFSIIGLSKTQISAMAFEIDSSVAHAEVHIHHDLTDGSLPSSLLSDKPSTYWRNSKPEDGTQAVVFAVPENERETSGASIANVVTIDTTTLIENPDLWIEASGQPMNAEEQGRLKQALKGLTQTDLISDVGFFARFVATTLDHLNGPVEQALDTALPELRLPRGAGRFKKPNSNTPPDAKKWAKAFDEIEKRTRDNLFLRSSTGAPQNRKKLWDQVDKLVNDNNLESDIAAVARDFLDDNNIASGQWQPSQARLVECPWNEVEKIFAKQKNQSDPIHLGRATWEFFDRWQPNGISTAERQMLEAIDEKTPATPDEETFLFDHRERLRRDYAQLHARWEKYIFRQPINRESILSGILLALRNALQNITQSPDDPVIYVVLPESQAPAFWDARKNTALCRYLRDSLRGLSEIVAPSIIIDLGVCWRSDVQEAMESATVGQTKNGASEFKFEVYVLDRTQLDDDGMPQTGVLRQAPKGQFTWSINATALPVQMPTDLRHLVSNDGQTVRLMTATIARNPKSDQRKTEQVTLDNCNSLLDAAGGNNGLLVNSETESDIGTQIRDQLSTFESNHVVSPEDAASVRSALDDFEAVYSRAIRAMIDPEGRGLADPALMEQAQYYGTLLTTIRTSVRANAARPAIWQMILSIGIAFSSDDPPIAIVTTWHPLRLAELAIKAYQFGELCQYFFRYDLTNVATLSDYFDDRVAALEAYHYPGVVNHRQNPDVVLATESNKGSYTLMASQTADKAGHTLFDAEPKYAAQKFMDSCDRYLQLKPHEQTNLTCVILNNESRKLPNILGRKLSERIDKMPRLRCEVILTHDNPAQLRHIYAEQNMQIGQDDDEGQDGLLSNETDTNFLSRLRVEFKDLDTLRETHTLGTPANLVLMQDVLARQARIGWRKVPANAPRVSLLDSDLNMTSRRCPWDPKRRSSATYLTPPQLPAPCQAYVNLLHDYVEQDETDGELSWLPVREVAFDNQTVQQVLESSHEIGDWVVNYDAIADRHLLEETMQDIRIIRHLSAPGTDHSVIVSARAPGQQLRQHLDDLLGYIVNFDADKRYRLIDQLLVEVSRISGQIIMRAARFERNTLELIGIALSKPLIRKLLGRTEPELAWFFLDDVASWLGHREGHVADILALSPYEANGQRFLDLVIVETKFVEESGHADHLKKSSRQLNETVRGFVNRFCSSDNAIDEPMWRGRLADMMLEYLKVFGDNNPETLASWAHDLRTGQLTIRIRGRSYGFVHDMAPDTDLSVDELDDGTFQLKLPRESIATLLRHEVGDCALNDIFPELPCDTGFVAQSSDREAQGAQSSGPVSDPVAIEHAIPSDDESPSDGPGTATSSEALVEATTTTESQTPESSEDDSNTADPVVTANGDTSSGHFPAGIRALLETNTHQRDTAAAQNWLNQTVDKLRIGLRECGMDCNILDARLTPNSALIHLQGSSRLTPKLINTYFDNLLVEHEVEITRVQKKPGRVVLAINRPERDFPSIREVWRQHKLPASSPESNTNLLIGVREDTGDPLYLNLAGTFEGQEEHAPHTLIAGQSGGGKGILVQNILFDICATNSPRSAQIWIIDPKKGLDYRWLEKMPHLARSMAIDQEAASQLFKELVTEMDRRNTLFRDTPGEPQKIDEYNDLVAPENRLPRIYVVHDEFAIWGQNKAYRQSAEEQINSLGQMARAAGIHIILITQRPDRDVMPLQARENLGNRLALHVANANNAELIGVPGAEKLLLKGQLAASLAGEMDIIYAQVPNITRDDMNSLTTAIRDKWTT